MSEIEVRLPDGKTLSVPAGSSVLDVAERIGEGLARAVLAGRVDGELVDLRVPIQRDVGLEIVTAKSPEAGDVIRHSAEHVMADAVKRLFPGAQIDVGRVVSGELFVGQSCVQQLLVSVIDAFRLFETCHRFSFSRFLGVS